MVATPEKFKELILNIKNEEIDAEAIKLLLAEYDEQSGLESVPTRSVSGLLKLIKEKGISFSFDSTLSPAYVLKQWIGSKPAGSNEEADDKAREDSHIEGGDSDNDSETPPSRAKKSKKRKLSRSGKSSKSRSKKARRSSSNSANLLDSLRNAASVESPSDSGSDSEASSFTKEKRKKRKASVPSSSSSSGDDSSSSSKSSSDSDDRIDRTQAALRPVAKAKRQMKLLCDKKESKNLYGGFTARALNITAYVASIKFRSMRNKREAETLGRTIDFIADQYGKKAITQMDACEVLLRRFTAVLHADSSTWEFATNFEECPEGPFVGVKMLSRVKKMAKLAGVRPPAMRFAPSLNESWRPNPEPARPSSDSWRNNSDRRREDRDHQKRPHRRLQGTRVQAPSRPNPDEE